MRASAPIRFPHWDMAIATGDRAADAIAGVESELDRLPYWWSDIGPRTFAEVGWADAATEWGEEDGLHVGRDATGEPVAVLVVDDPRKLRAGRALARRLRRTTLAAGEHRVRAAVTPPRRDRARRR